MNVGDITERHAQARMIRFMRLEENREDSFKQGCSRAHVSSSRRQHRHIAKRFGDTRITGSIRPLIDLERSLESPRGLVVIPESAIEVSQIDEYGRMQTVFTRRVLEQTQCSHIRSLRLLRLAISVH